MRRTQVNQLVIIIFLLLDVITAMSQALSVGMQAPPLKVGKWVKGGPIEVFKPGQIYVVEFWATWCKPCLSVIPMLSNYAEKYKGKVTVIGVSVHEENMANVAPFVKKMGEKMNYNVAIDKPEGPTTEQGYMVKNWLFAAGIHGLPSTFVVGKTGIIEYIGNADLRSVLPQMVEGTWAVISDGDWLKSPLGSKRVKIESLFQPENHEKALKELDEYAKMPGAGRDLFPRAWALAQKAIVYMWMGRSEEYYRTAKELYEMYKTIPASYIGWALGDRTKVLNNVIVWPIVDPEEAPYIKITRTDEDYKFALEVANHMVEFNREDLSAMDSKAWAYYQLGDYSQAASIFEKIRELAPHDELLRASYEKFKSKIK